MKFKLPEKLDIGKKHMINGAMVTLDTEYLELSDLGDTLLVTNPILLYDGSYSTQYWTLSLDRKISGSPSKSIEGAISKSNRHKMVTKRKDRTKRTLFEAYRDLFNPKKKTTSDINQVISQIRAESHSLYMIRDIDGEWYLTAL
jgi:hypothetical protein